MDSNGIYTSLPSTEDREGLLVNSEVGSSAGSNDKNWRSSDFTKLDHSKRTLISALRDYWWIYTTLLLIFIAGLQLIIWHELRAYLSDSSRQVGGDYTGKGPIFAAQSTKWNADYEYVPLSASAFLHPKVQAKWEMLLPEGAGFVGGPDSIEVYNSTSVTHQIHCVYIMAKIFSAVVTKSSSIPEAADYEAHFLHCADYMRQAAMCAGDVTLEPRGENGKPAEVTLENAFNGVHVCKDYNQVRSYLADQLREGARNILPLDD